MIRKSSVGLVLGVLASLLAIGGGHSTSAAEEELTELKCTATEPEEPERVGDAPIIQGFIVSRGDELGFQPCHSDDIYFIQASFTVWDTLEGRLRTDPGADPSYVRFRGAELQCASAIPEPFVGGVRIDEILAAGTPPPANCE